MKNIILRVDLHTRVQKPAGCGRNYGIARSNRRLGFFGGGSQMSLSHLRLIFIVDMLSL
jgi:hypothetical protein